MSLSLTGPQSLLISADKVIEQAGERPLFESGYFRIGSGVRIGDFGKPPFRLISPTDSRDRQLRLKTSDIATQTRDSAIGQQDTATWPAKHSACAVRANIRQVAG